MLNKAYILQLKELRLDDGHIVGGKNANLGELLNAGLPVPNGFAITTHVYDELFSQGDTKEKIYNILKKVDFDNIANLNSCSREIRKIIEEIPIPQNILALISENYNLLGTNVEVAVRSSATAEDLPTASFAGQMDSFLFIRGTENVIKSIKKTFSSMFSPRAIYYRNEKGFDHFSVKIGITIQRMLSPKSAGVMFTLNPVDGNTDIIYIEGSWGVGETIVQGKVEPDSFTILKSDLSISKNTISTKKTMTIRGETQGEYSIAERASITEVDVPEELQNQPCLTEDQVIDLSKYAKIIEEHYGKPMDIEWVVENNTDNIYLVQARPETVHSKKIVKEEKTESTVIAKGIGASAGVRTGVVHVITDIQDADKFKENEILITPMTTPDWTPIMKKATAIITQSGGATAHAAIVSRELGIPCIVGVRDAITTLSTGQEITIDGSTGFIYEGSVHLSAQEEEISLPLSNESWPITRTSIYMNLGQPDLIEKYKGLPFDGIGLMRTELIIANITADLVYGTEQPKLTGRANALSSVHPLQVIADGKQKYFIDELYSGISKVASAIFPRPVIVRFSDFKTNEYKLMYGGDKYEIDEENPMIGWRGISRYVSKKYEPAFRLECQVIKKLRDDGFSNVWVMLPFARKISEVQQTLKIMEDEGLERSKFFKVWLMAETPSFVLLADQFANYCDGFSIGSNDLTQLILGVDRDSELLATMGYFNEQDPAVLKAIRHLISVAHDKNITISICGQAPSDQKPLLELLISCSIDSISVNPDAVINTRRSVAGAERKQLLRLRKDKFIDSNDLEPVMPS